jgi:hypothetical protein
MATPDADNAADVEVENILSRSRDANIPARRRRPVSDEEKEASRKLASLLERKCEHRYHQRVVDILQAYPALANKEFHIDHATSSRQPISALPFFHMVAAKGVTEEILETVYDLNPQAIATPVQRNWSDMGGLPLHHACRHGASAETLMFLIQKYPEALWTKVDEDAPYGGEDLPIHLALSGGEISVASIDILAKRCPPSLHVKEEKHGYTPLELALSNGYRPEIISCLIQNLGPELNDLQFRCSSHRYMHPETQQLLESILKCQVQKSVLEVDTAVPSLLKSVSQSASIIHLDLALPLTLMHDEDSHIWHEIAQILCKNTVLRELCLRTKFGNRSRRNFNDYYSLFDVILHNGLLKAEASNLQCFELESFVFLDNGMTLQFLLRMTVPGAYPLQFDVSPMSSICLSDSEEIFLLKKKRRRGRGGKSRRRRRNKKKQRNKKKRSNRRRRNKKMTKKREEKEEEEEEEKVEGHEIAPPAPASKIVELKLKLVRLHEFGRGDRTIISPWAAFGSWRESLLERVTLHNCHLNDNDLSALLEEFSYMPVLKELHLIFRPDVEPDVVEDDGEIEARPTESWPDYFLDNDYDPDLHPFFEDIATMNITEALVKILENGRLEALTVLGPVVGNDLTPLRMHGPIVDMEAICKAMIQNECLEGAVPLRRYSIPSCINDEAKEALLLGPLEEQRITQLQRVEFPVSDSMSPQREKIEYYVGWNRFGRDMVARQASATDVSALLEHLGTVSDFDPSQLRLQTKHQIQFQLLLETSGVWTSTL